MTDDLAAILATLPALAGFSGEAQRLGGLTNRVYRVGDLVLRLPGAGTGAYINRVHEAAAARLAAAAGVSPSVLHADPETGLMVTAYIEAATMTPDGFRTRPGAPARAGHSGKRTVLRAPAERAIRAHRSAGNRSLDKTSGCTRVTRTSS